MTPRLVTFMRLLRAQGLPVSAAKVWTPYRASAG